MSKKAVIFNLGCKVNQYECDVIASGLSAMGYETSETLGYADVYVINTCAVTAEAERKSRQVIARIRKYNADARIFVTGCASQKNSTFYIEKGVTYVSGVGGKNKIFELCAGDFVSELPTEYEESEYLPEGDRTRAYVKIQDGCNNFCSYCIIPYLRGRSRSRKIEACAKEIRALAKSTPEIVITGVNLAQYGSDTGESLAGLMRAIADVDVRIRLGSFYVEGVNEELLSALCGLKEFCPQFHLSLQNGDDGVLKDMNRHYGTAEYKEKVALIRKYFPLAAITTDVIIGYPTETEEAFANTLEFVKEVGFSDLHIFPFSPREGTVAYKLKPLQPSVIEARRLKLEAEREILRNNYIEKMFSIPQKVVFERIKNGYAEGYSQFYVRVYLQTELKYAIINPTGRLFDGITGVVI